MSAIDYALIAQIILPLRYRHATLHAAREDVPKLHGEDPRTVRDQDPDLGPNRILKKKVEVCAIVQCTDLPHQIVFAIGEWHSTL